MERGLGNTAHTQNDFAAKPIPTKQANATKQTNDWRAGASMFGAQYVTSTEWFTLTPNKLATNKWFQTIRNDRFECDSREQKSGRNFGSIIVSSIPGASVAVLGNPVGRFWGLQAAAGIGDETGTKESRGRSSCRESCSILRVR